MMKKSFFTLILMFVASMALHAQSLTGKQWCTMIAQEYGPEAAIAFTLEEKGTGEFISAIEGEIEDSEVNLLFNLSVNLVVPITYQLDGKDLNVTFDKDKAEVELDYRIVGDETETKAEFEKEFTAEIDNTKLQMKEGLLSIIANLTNMKIVSHEDKRLIVKDNDGNEITFYCE